MPTRKELYKDLIFRLQAQTRGTKLTQINKFFNCFSYEREITDYWKTQEEFLKDGCGDCDDFAIAKYFALLNLGFDKSTLKLAYVHILFQGKKEAHMVLLYKHSDILTIVLDNYNKKIHRFDNRHDMELIYSFDDEYIYFEGQVLNNNHTKWLSLKDRMNENVIV